MKISRKTVLSIAYTLLFLPPNLQTGVLVVIRVRSACSMAHSTAMCGVESVLMGERMNTC